MGIINPVGTGAWLRRSSSVNGSGSAVVHTVGEDGFRVIRYVFAMYNTTEDKTKSLEFMVHKEGGTIKTTVHNRIGKQISLGINAAINSGNLEVTITNNETFELDVEFAYLILGRD